MQPDLQHALSPQTRTFRYSLDWRFLLPLGDARKIHVLSEDESEFGLTLEQVGIPVSKQITLSNFKQNEGSTIQSLALPFGLPARWVDAKHEDQIELYHSLRNVISPGGSLLVGFNSIWNIRGTTSSQYHPSTPRLIADQLKQAGFQSLKLFGAMPNLSIPEYIFNIEARAIHFALHHRYRRKPVLIAALRALSRTIGVESISNFLPCYFAVATV